MYVINRSVASNFTYVVFDLLLQDSAHSYKQHTSHYQITHTYVYMTCLYETIKGFVVYFESLYV